MAINASGAVAVPLTVFGSWVTEVSPDSVPENISPDCADVVFSPGNVGSRPGLEKVFGTPFPAGGVNGQVPTLVSGFSYTLPTGTIQNLYYDSNGVLWVEYLTTTPGTYTKLLQSTPNSFCRFMSAFGRVYIAISDGLHGAEAPIQYDGTNLDRFTNDAPGIAPSVTSITLPAVTMTTSGSPTTTAITSITTTDPVIVGTPPNTFTVYTSLTLVVASTAGLSVNEPVAISGATGLNGSEVITQIIDLTHLKTGLYGGLNTFTTATGGTLTGTPNVTLVRANNSVLCTTSAAHNLQVGYQAQITGVPALAVGGGITSIVIDNEDLPGLATVTTTNPHGLLPENDVTITGVAPASVGGSWSANWDGSTTTMTSGTAHGLVPGAVISISGGSGATAVFNTTVTVALVPGPTAIAFSATYLGTAPLTASGLTVSIAWPVPDDTPDPTYFEVESCPTPTTFQVQVTYSDGTWTSGNVSFAWNGTFYVQTVPSTTSFSYLQYGPNGSTTTAGTVTPFGQCAPGLHLVAVCFLDENGGITAPSPFATFESNGGQYINLTNIPLGPNPTVARILVFTGAQPNVPGELPPFYYIPTISQLEGQIVGTATQIDDNATTNVVLDFSDNTLYAATGISIPGNDLANQFVLEGALGFGAYSSRLTTWGQRNTVDNLIGMHFASGVNGAGFLVGWNTSANVGGILTGTQVRGLLGWQITVPNTGAASGQLSQSAYLDAYGDPIITGDTPYLFRVRLAATFLDPNLNFFAQLSSASTGFTSLATFNGANMGTDSPFGSLGTYEQQAFSLTTPDTIPADLTLTIWATSTSGLHASIIVAVTEMSIIYADTPYLDQDAFASYVNNPNGMDGDAGEFGANDPSKLMDMAELRDTLYLLTQAPSGRLHETNGSGTSQPSGWDVSEVAANCGVISAFGLTHSQADDTAASGGDDWMAWPSDSGAYIFGGGLPEKITQEIQPNWNDPTTTDTAVQINFAAATCAWGLCDPVARLLYFGLPIGTATAPNKIYVLDFKNLGSAAAIAGSPPFHPSYSGKLIATDNSRKWAPYNMTMNGGARMYRENGQLEIVLFGGNGLTPGVAAGKGNVYLLNPAFLTDDDFGQIFPYYTTYAFIDPEKAQALGLAGVRILMAYIQAYIQGTGTITATYYPDDLANLWSLTTTRSLTTFYGDRQIGGAMCSGDRIFIKISSSPVTGTDNGFTMSRLTAYVKNAKLKVSGVNK